jgi:hypothetical protein
MTAVARVETPVAGGLVAVDSVTDLLRVAIEKGTPVEALEKLVSLHERMEARQAARLFAEAMGAFQRECPQIKKGSTAKIATKSGSSYEFTFAPLEEIAAVINPILARHGLSYNWDMTVKDGMLTDVCTVRHIAGHSVPSSVTVPIATSSGMSEQQKVSAANTFAKRLSLSNALGIITMDDDPEAKEADPTPISDDQATVVADRVKDLKINAGKFLKYVGAKSVATIRAVDYERAIAALDQYEAKRGDK